MGLEIIFCMDNDLGRLQELRVPVVAEPVGHRVRTDRIKISVRPIDPSFVNQIMEQEEFD